MNQDFLDLLGALVQTGARFLVVGAHAMAVHGVPRATGDLDVWIARDPENADRVFAALARFGAPLATLAVSRDDLLREDQVLQVGLPPRRIDVLTHQSIASSWVWPGRGIPSCHSEGHRRHGPEESAVTPTADPSRPGRRSRSG